MKDEVVVTLILHPSAFILHPSSFRAHGTYAFGIGRSPVTPNCWMSIPAVERLTNHAALLAGLVSCLFFCVPAFAQAPLELGMLIERELARGQVQMYRVSLLPGQFVRIKVEQKGTDILLKLRDFE